MRKRKIIVWDLETMPDLKEVAKRIPGLGAWPGRTLKSDMNSIISFGYKILGEKKTHCINAWDFKKDWKKDRSNDYNVVKAASEILNDADGFITHNGKSFDVKVLNSRLALYGLPGLPKIKHSDTRILAKGNLNLYSNSLSEVAKFLGCTPKMQIHGKWDLWVDIMLGYNLEKSQKIMSTYCKQDVNTTEEVYYKLRQYDTAIPNINLHEGLNGCPTCGSDKLQKNGFIHSKTAIKQRYRCLSCGSSCSRPNENKIFRSE